jgi:hypothetical protein
MQQHEREYLVSRIRSGFYFVNSNSLRLKIVTPTISEELEINEAYNEAYKKALEENFMTFNQMLEWMQEKEIWTYEDDMKLNGLKKDIEKLKVEMFNVRKDKKQKNMFRAHIRSCEKQYETLNNKKNTFYENTCEGIASTEKVFTYLKLCTYIGNEIFPLLDKEIDNILNGYYSQILKDTAVRELARSEPWRSLWVLNDSDTFNLFQNTKENRELSIDQKNLLVWSKMYENIHESPECPTDEIIEDDDLLDAWFIIQKEKREKEKLSSEVNDTIKNDKIKNSSEIFMVAKNKDHAREIDSMNSVGSTIVKNKRSNLLKEKSTVNQFEFQDEQIKLSRQSQQMFKDKFRR